MIEFASVQMANGEVFDGKKIGELTEYIINKFSEEGLNHDKAQIVLDRARAIIGECCVIQSLDRK